MIDTLLRALGGAAEAVTNQQSRRRGQDAANAEASKFIHTEAQKAADAGDWQWMYDNEDALTQHIHPDVLNALVSKTKLNNARNYDAQTADGERPVIPLSPKNVLERGQMANINGNMPFYNQTSRPTDATGQAAVPSAAQAVAQVAGNQGPYNGEVGGFAQPGFPTSGGGGQAPDAQTGVSSYQTPSMVGTHPRGIEQDVVPADMSTARQPTMQAPVESAAPVPPPTQPTSSAPATQTPTITLPEPRRPQSMSIDIGSTKINRQAVEHTSEGLTASALAQAKQHGLPLDAAVSAITDYNIKAAKKGLPGIKVDQAQIQAHQTEQFHSLMATEQQRLLQSGALDPALAHQAAARYASQQLGGFTPPNFDTVVGYTPEERHTARLNHALSMADMQISGAMKVLAASKNPSELPADTLYDIVQQTQGLSPADKQGLLVDAAQRLAPKLAEKLVASGAATQETAPLLAARLAGHFTGGEVPTEWKKAVLSTPQTFGLSPAATQLYMSDPDRFNVFTAKGMQNLNNAERGNAIALDQLKSVDPEAAAAGLDILRQQQASSRTPEATISDALRTAGQRNRGIVVEQEGRKTTETTRARETQERKEAVKASIPMLQDAVQAMRDAQRASQGLGGAAKAYIPGTDAYNASKLYTEKIDTYKNAIAKGLFAQSGNLTEKEQKDAAQAFADWWDARFKPDVAKKKVETLNRLMSKHYGKRIDLNAQDPFNPEAVQPRVYGKDGKQAGKEPAAESTTPAKPPAGVRLYDKTGKRTQ